MDSNLMRATGLYLDPQQSEILKAFRDFENCVSRPAGLSFEHGHSRSIVGSPADSSFNLSAFLSHPTVDKRHVHLEHRALAKLIRQSLMRDIVLRNDQQARRVFVQTMDDAWS